MPDLFRFTAGAVERVRAALEGLAVNPDRMRANLELTGGLIMAEALSMALAPRVGRIEAHRIVQAACERATDTGVDLRRAALDDQQVRAVLSPDAIARAFDPSAYLGSTDTFIERALKRFRELQSSRG